MANFNQQAALGYTGTTPVQFPYGTVPYNNYMGQVNQQQNLFNQNQYLKCRPVTSKEQAMASQIDLDGSLWIFTDLNHERIYTKKINNDGTAAFETYLLTKEPEPIISNDYVTREQFNKVIQSLVAAMGTKSTETADANNF